MSLGKSAIWIVARVADTRAQKYAASRVRLGKPGS